MLFSEVNVIKKQVLITVHYVVEAENDDFWDGNTGHVSEQISESLEKRFPQTIALTETLGAKRYSLWHEPIDYPNANVMKCPVCKRFITDTTKPRPIYRLDAAKELAGIMMCSSCAWELEYDIQCGRSIEEIMARFNET